MPLLFPNSSEARALGNILNHIAPSNLSLRLYTNSWAPEDASHVNSFVEMGAVGGYAAIPMTASSWSIVGGAPTQATFPVQSWTFTASAGPVWGYLVTEDTGGHLKWAEQFSAPITITQSGDKININPVVQLRKQGE